MSEPIRILFVCLGNICRSPTAEGVFFALATQREMQANLSVDSAGTGGWHVGQPADRRMQVACRRRGYSLTSRARQVADEDFANFDHIFAMDRDNHQDLLARCPPEHRTKVRLFRQLDPEPDSLDVPDPYYGGPEGFEEVVDIAERCSRQLLDELAAARNKTP